MPLKPLEAHLDGAAAVLGIGKSVITARKYLQVFGWVGRVIEGLGMGEGDEFIRLPVQEEAVAHPLNGPAGIISLGIVIEAILQPDPLFRFYNLFSPFEQGRGGPEHEGLHPRIYRCFEYRDEAAHAATEQAEAIAQERMMSCQINNRLQVLETGRGRRGAELPFTFAAPLMVVSDHCDPLIGECIPDLYELLAILAAEEPMRADDTGRPRVAGHVQYAVDLFPLADRPDELNGHW